MVVTTRIRVIGTVAGACAALAVAAVVGAGSTPHAAHADTAAVAGDTVTVDGTGTVQGVPDKLTASFGVHVTRASVHDALDGVAGDANRLISALHRAGVDDKNVRTTDLQLSPHFDNDGHRDGYDASESVAATFTDLSSAGRGISDTAASAGNAATVDGLSFDLSSDTKLLAQARQAAYADAKARAQQYADLAGRSLGAVRHVTESVMSSDTPQPYKGYDLAAGASGAASPVPVAAGQQPVTVVVTVVWQLS